MDALPTAPWGRHGARLLVLAGGLLLLVIWAPVPAAFQLAFRAAIFAGFYIAMVVRLWREAAEALDCDDPHLSPRCQERLRRSMEQHPPTPRTAPLTPVQGRYLSGLSRYEERQEERHD